MKSSRPETDDAMKVKGNKRREGGTMSSQGFSKLCYKRAFDSGEGMGRGWEWVGLGVIRTNYVDGVDRSLVGFTKKHVDKAEWTEKKVDVGQIIK